MRSRRADAISSLRSRILRRRSQPRVLPPLAIPYQECNVFVGQLRVRPEQARVGPPEDALGFATDADDAHCVALRQGLVVLAIGKHEVVGLGSEEIPLREDDSSLFDVPGADLPEAHDAPTAESSDATRRPASPLRAASAVIRTSRYP